MKKSFGAIILVLAILLAFKTPALSEEEKKPVFDLGEIVVTGTLKPLEVKNIPADVTVITEKDIDEIKPLDIGDILEGVPGVYIMRQGSLGQLETIQVRGGQSRQVLIMIDGVPMNSPNLGTVDLSELPVNDIKKIEIVRGPYSALYGDRAMNGVVNIITRESKPGTGYKASATYGSFNTLLASLEIGSGNKKTSFVIRPSIKSTDGARQNSYQRLDDLYFRLDQKMGRAKFALTGNSLKSKTGTPGVRPSADFSQRSQTQQVLGNDDISAPYDYTWSRESLYNARLSWGNLDVSTYYKYSKPSYYFERIDFPNNLHKQSDTSNMGTWGGEIRYRMPLSKTSTLTGGIYGENTFFGYTSNDLDVPNNTVATTSSEYSRNNIAYYLEYLLNSDRVTFSAGARYDRFTGFGSQLTPRAGLKYKFSENVAAYTSYGVGFSAPTLNDLYWPQDSYAVGNPNLQPEKNTTFEAGLEFLPSKKIFFRTTYFSDNLKNAIIWLPVGSPGPFGNRWMPGNLNSLIKRGVEAELKWKLSNTLTFNTNYTQISAWQTNYELVQQFPDVVEARTRKAASVPGWLFNGSLSCQVAKDFDLMVSMNSAGKKYNYYANYNAWPAVTTDVKELKGYTVFDVRLSKKFKGEKNEGEIFLLLSNIFNEKYATNFGNTITDRDFPLPGSAIYIGGNLKL
ncbi:MAG: TonB-dependent receptor [Chloroflexi bacterium]|nr:TonB-dependent receptor [Chloroflexota bacterium]